MLMGKLLNLIDVNNPINLCISTDFLFTSCPSCSWQLRLCSCQSRLYVWLLHICHNIPSQHTFHGQISHRLLLNMFLDNMEGKPGLSFGWSVTTLHKWIFRSWACWGQSSCCFWNRKSMAILLERPLNGCQAEWCSSKLCSAESSSRRSHNRCSPVRPQVLCEPLCHLIFTVGNNIPLRV